MKYKKLNHCLCCNSDKLFLILDLGEQPLANSYHKGEKLEKYPNQLNLCLDCYHSQLSIAVNPDEMFKNYLYVSGTSSTGREYFEWLSNYLYTKYCNKNNPKPLKILDIACNDGSQLECFKKYNCELYGVDPAENLAQISKEKGINLTVGYWGENIANSLPLMDFIIAQNVLAHNDYPQEFLKCCKKIMNENTILIVQTSQANMFLNNEFDTVYHEHISFFSARSMEALTKNAGLEIIDVFKPSIHGTSYVFVIKRIDPNKTSPSKSLDYLIEKEHEEGRYDVAYYEKFSNFAKYVVSNLKIKIEEYKQKGYKIVGYGAAGKGITLLNFGNIKLDYIVDDNELKWGLKTPGMDIDVKNPNELEKESGNICIIPLAWNFFDEIRKKVKLRRRNKDDIFILYFPKISVV
ncbi:MAG: class I SAM-dependent methyltransferase [Nanoarchaeota archaeon]